MQYQHSAVQAQVCLPLAGDDLFEHKVHLESAVQLKAGDTLEGFRTPQFLATTKSGSVTKWEEVLVCVPVIPQTALPRLSP